MIGALKVNRTLTTIALDGCSFSIRQLTGAEPIATLDLSEMELGDASGLVIAHLITGNTSLTQLDIRSNNLGVESSKAMADMLTTNTSLTQLDLRKNKAQIHQRFVSGRTRADAEERV